MVPCLSFTFNSSLSLLFTPTHCTGPHQKSLLIVALTTFAVSQEFETGTRDGSLVSPETRLCERSRLTTALNSLHQTIRLVQSSCTNMRTLDEGKCLHFHILEQGFDEDLFLVNNLLSIYVKCGSMLEASQVFQNMPRRNVVSWTTIVAGYAQHGHGEEAFAIFKKMQSESVKPNKVTFISLLNACTSPSFFTNGKMVHSHIIHSGLESHIMVGTALIKMYSNCSSIEDACHMFNKTIDRDVVSWTTIIAIYVKHGRGREALELFWQMQQEGIKPNHYTFNIIFNACASLATLAEGKKIHAHIVETGFEADIFVGNALLDMYAKCGSIEFARRLFEQMPKRDAVSWNAMIAGLAQHGNGQEALDHFEQMKQEGLKPDQFTFSCVLSVCSSLTNLSLGKEVHRQIRKAGFESERIVVNALIDMYAKCGSMQEAQNLFYEMGMRDEISWTAMIAGCARHQCGKEALELFGHMPERDVFSWTAIIQGHTQRGQHKEALELFQDMQCEGVNPNEFTFGTILSACAGLSDLEQGKQLHAHIIKMGFQSIVSVENAVVDMYARCGSIDDARQLFNKMPERDVVSWNVMIGGYAHHGNGKGALEIFKQMQHESMKPDEFTFSSVLNACKHDGLIREGCHYFICMIRSHGITPTVQHYSCIVDLLGRAGCLDEAEGFISRIPSQPDIVAWMSLLSACRSHVNVELAEQIKNQILKLEPRNAAALVLLSNIFAACGRWDDQSEVRHLMKRKD